jgi:hypothetical protein
MRDRLNEIAKLWVQWNIQELPATNFAIAVGDILKSETNKEWKHYLLKQKIESKMVKR